jgi:hypothetical protein
MSRRFIIVYRGREGSSPIVNYLKLHPDIIVPVFEELDANHLQSFCGGDKIAGLVGLTLRCGNYKLAREIFENPSLEAPERAAKAVGFKWRAWGDTDPLVETCVREEVTAFHLFRANLLDLALSLHFTHIVVPEVERTRGINLQGGGNLQFKLLPMTEEQREELRNRLASIHFSIDLEQFVARVRSLYEDKRRIQEKYITPMRRAGVRVYALRYEDFVQDEAAFLERLCAILGVDHEKLDGVAIAFHRVGNGRLTEQVTNWAEVATSPEIRKIIEAYEALIDELDDIHRVEDGATVAGG